MKKEVQLKTAKSINVIKDVLSKDDGVYILSKEYDPDSTIGYAITLFFDGHAAAATYLSVVAKKEKYRRMINDHFPDRGKLYNGLKSDSPKLRKNTARLLGALENSADTEVLVNALNVETIEYVIPSILLALGNMHCETAHIALCTYSVPQASNGETSKHISDIRAALSSAGAKYVKAEKHCFTGFEKPILFELNCPQGMADILVDELKAVNLDAKKLRQNCVSVTTNDYQRLFSARTFREVVIPIVKDVQANEIIRAIHPNFYDILLLSHSKGNENPFRYRVEVCGEPNERVRLIRDICDYLDREVGGLANSASDYEVELRLEAAYGRKYNIYLKLFTHHDSRFDYKRYNVPASMQPPTAAGVVRLAAPYVQNDRPARVLDCCCGSGTLLFERERLSECEHLLGIDIDEKAVCCAKNNQTTGKTEFICADAKTFRPTDKFDEMYVNLPFGNRVGTHSDNVHLYEKIMSNIPAWIKPGGVAVLYTMESALVLSKTIECRKNQLKLRKRIRTDAGGAEPNIFVFTVEQ